MIRINKLVASVFITSVMSYALCPFDASAAGKLTGLFNCKIEESKRWSFNSSSDWNAENFIRVSQFNIEYGITDDSYLYLKGLNYEEVPFSGFHIDLKPTSIPTIHLQFHNYRSRVRANQIITDNSGKLMLVNKIHFDKDFVFLETLDHNLSLTRASEDNWMGVMTYTHAGKWKKKRFNYCHSPYLQE